MQTLQTQIISSGNTVYTDQMLMVLKQSFKPQPITPTTTLEKIMYDAGIQHVINHIEQKIATARSSSS